MSPSEQDQAILLYRVGWCLAVGETSRVSTPPVGVPSRVSMLSVRPMLARDRPSPYVNRRRLTGARGFFPARFFLASRRGRALLPKQTRCASFQNPYPENPSILQQILLQFETAPTRAHALSPNQPSLFSTNSPILLPNSHFFR